FRKCIECFLCQNVCHVIRDHEDNKKAFAGPRFLMRMAELGMHPLDTHPNRAEEVQDEHGLGYCNITKCCTEVCPEHIKITDHALIPMKERGADRKDDPVVWLGNKLFRRRCALRQPPVQAAAVAPWRTCAARGLSPCGPPRPAAGGVLPHRLPSVADLGNLGHNTTCGEPDAAGAPAGRIRDGWIRRRPVPEAETALERPRPINVDQSRKAVMTVGRVYSINEIRKAIRELTLRAQLARKENRLADAAEIEDRIQRYREELAARP